MKIDRYHGGREGDGSMVTHLLKEPKILKDTHKHPIGRPGVENFGPLNIDEG